MDGQVYRKVPSCQRKNLDNRTRIHSPPFIGIRARKPQEFRKKPNLYSDLATGVR